MPPADNKLIRSDGSLTIGTCDDNDKAIYIDYTLSDRMMKKVLVHEIVHSCCFSYNVNLTKDQEELLADIIATYGSEIITIANKVFKKIKGDY